MEEPEPSNSISLPTTSTVGIANKSELYQIQSEPLRLALLECKKSLGIPEHSIQIVATDESEIQQLNKKFRNKDTVTDVISFAYADFSANPEVKPRVGSPLFVPENHAENELGDIFICMERTRQQALDIGQSISAEFMFLCIHGLLHLCGYDHQQEREEHEMVQEQKKLILRLKESGHYPTDFIKTKENHV